MDGTTVQNNMMKLNGWRKAGINCDVTLFIDGQEFHAHKSILAASIKFFEKLFTDDFDEKGKNAITLKDVDPDGFRLILDYIYTGKIKIDDDNFAQVLSVAFYYQIECLMEMLFDYVKNNISTNNGFYYYHSADSIGVEKIKQFTKEFIRNDFLSCSHSVAFLDITYSSLLEFIDSSVKEELDRFKIIMNWIQFDLNNRSDYLSDLIKHVRFAYISNDEVVNDIMDYPLVINNLEIIKAIRERRKMEQTVKIYGMKGSDLIRVDIFNAKLEATNVIVETDVNYEEFQICSSDDAVYVSTFRYGTGNKLYRFKDSQWTFLDNSVYNPNVAHRSIAYSEKDKTIYAYNKLCLYSYNCESKSYVVDLDISSDIRRSLIEICGSVVFRGGILYAVVRGKSDYYCMLYYIPSMKLFKCIGKVSTCSLNTFCAMLGEEMFIISDGIVQMYNVLSAKCTVLVQNEREGISYHSLTAYKNQLYAIRKKWDVIDVFDISKERWIDQIYLG